MTPGVFVTATDTGVGKSVLSAVLCAALVARGLQVSAFKPALTGLDEDLTAGVPRDDELLASLTGQRPQEVAPERFGPAVSPHLAAQLAGRTLDVPGLVRAARVAGAGADALVIEGVGGLLVPLAPGWDVRRLACALGFPVLLAARPGLGTINHTLLSLEGARSHGLDVRGVVLTPWPKEPPACERSNLETIAALAGGIPVHTLAPVGGFGARELAHAAGPLPVKEWFAESSVPSAK